MNRVFWLGTVACYLGLAFAACTGGDGSRVNGEWEAVVDTVGDTVVLRTVSGSVWGDTVWAVTRDELDVARIVRFRLTHQ